MELSLDNLINVIKLICFKFFFLLSKTPVNIFSLACGIGHFETKPNRAKILVLQFDWNSYITGVKPNTPKLLTNDISGRGRQYLPYGNSIPKC